MLVTAMALEPPEMEACFHKRLIGPDRGLINAWLVGLSKRRSDPGLAEKASAGELPPLIFKGGVARKIKGTKIGSLHYMAAWQGLRGENLHLRTDEEPMLRCARTKVSVTYTLDMNKLFSAAAGVNNE